MRVLVVTAMYPTAARPTRGVYIQEQVASLRRAGVEVEVHLIDGRDSLGKYLRAAPAVRARARSGRFDVVHAHYGLAGLPSCLQRACPVVVTYHGSDLLGEVDRAGRYRWVGRLKVLLGQLAGVAARRRIVVAEILARRLWRRDAAVVPMGVDLELFRPLPREAARRELGLDLQARYVLFLADPAVGVKRFDVARAAVDLLGARGVAATLLPVHGVDHARIPQYMAACDVLVLTSNHEASPCAVKEALACDLPVVAVRVGDVPERLAGVRNCHLCERTPEDVARALALVLADGGRSDGRARVQEISLEHTARRVIAVYESALGRTGTTPSREPSHAA